MFSNFENIILKSLHYFNFIAENKVYNARPDVEWRKDHRAPGWQDVRYKWWQDEIDAAYFLFSMFFKTHERSWT